MRTYELYFNGPSAPSERFSYELSPEHMYADFIQTIYSSGYSLGRASIKYTNNKKFVTIEVSGFKND